MKVIMNIFISISPQILVQTLLTKQIPFNTHIASMGFYFLIP